MNRRTANSRRRRAERWEKRIDETCYLTGNRRGALLKEEVWYQGDEVVKYSLTYVNPTVHAGDNGRVLGYDNSHDHHHRHFMGHIEAFEFTGYQALVHRFEREVHQLWREEDEEKT